MYTSAANRMTSNTAGNHRHSRHHSSRTRLIVILSVALAIEVIVTLTALIRVGLTSKENIDLERAERNNLTELEVLQPKVDKLAQELALLTQGRLPDLRRLEYDKVMTIDRAYVKNIVFTVAVQGGQKLYEYKLVMQNSTMNSLHPRLDLILFDRNGVEVGRSRVGIQSDGVLTTEMLDRGEIRSLTSRVEVANGDSPQYFRLVIDKPVEKNTGRERPASLSE